MHRPSLGACPYANHPQIPADSVQCHPTIARSSYFYTVTNFGSDAKIMILHLLLDLILNNSATGLHLLVCHHDCSFTQYLYIIDPCLKITKKSFLALALALLPVHFL